MSNYIYVAHVVDEEEYLDAELGTRFRGGIVVEGFYVDRTDDLVVVCLYGGDGEDG